MASNQINLAIYNHKSFFNNRLLGTFGMIAAPMLLIEGLYRYFTNVQDNQNNQVVGLLSIIYVAGWISSIIGMRRLRITGSNNWSMIIFVVQMIGLFLAGLWALQEIVHINFIRGNVLFNICDSAWPLSHLFMLVMGGFVIKAKVWRGWRKFPPFMCGLALPAFIAASIFGVKDAGIALFQIMTTVGFVSLGYVVRTSNQREG
jgi:hypothetical protein